jgi:hypothetical protein
MINVGLQWFKYRGSGRNESTENQDLKITCFGMDSISFTYLVKLINTCKLITKTTDHEKINLNPIYRSGCLFCTKL